MVKLKFYGGVNEIGGNRILVEDKGVKVFLDFGMSFSKYGEFFEEYVKPRYSCAGLKDLLALKLIPCINGVYRRDLLRIIGKPLHKRPSVDGILVSHIHQDHSAYVSLLDERIPVYCSEATMRYAKAILETGHRSLETEIYGFKKRPLTDGSTLVVNRVFNQVGDGQPFKIDSITVKPFSVDHSVAGAMAFIIHTSNKTIAYTGDLRLQGARGDLTRRFLEKASREDVDVLLCEGTRVDEEEPGSEENVALNADRVVSTSRQLVVADFAYKDLHRFLTFYRVAVKNNRKIAVSKRHAYLLNELRKSHLSIKIPPIADENILIYIERKKTGRYSESDYDAWERGFLKMANAVDAEHIHRNQSRIVVCLSFYDISELIDIKPNRGSVYIHSASEPHNEEQAIDERRLNRWLDFFKLRKHHFHASGHASGPEIREIIEAISPREVVPIHTEKPELFDKMHSNVKKPKPEEF